MINENKPDFSNVQSGTQSTAKMQDKPDFSNVQSGVQSTAKMVEPAQTEQTYTVASGDTLSHIARHFYGHASQWHAIFDANRDQIDDPDKIFPGQVLKIPAAPTPKAM